MTLQFRQLYPKAGATTSNIPHISQRKLNFVSQENFKFHLVMAMYLAEEVLLCVGYVIIFITNITGNLLVCAIVFKTKKLRNFTSILIVNMAVGDLIVGVVGVMHIILEVWFLINWWNQGNLSSLRTFKWNCTVQCVDFNLHHGNFSL